MGSTTDPADRARSIRPVAAGSRVKRGYFGPGHPVAGPARRRCHELHPQVISGLGGVACGRCWEQAIRDDERAVMLFGLPREIDPDPGYVDPIAVERVCAGERSVRLTAAEKAAAVAVLAARGWLPSRAAEHLGLAHRRVRELWPRPQVESLGPEAA